MKYILFVISKSLLAVIGMSFFMFMLYVINCVIHRKNISSGNTKNINERNRGGIINRD